MKKKKFGKLLALLAVFLLAGSVVAGSVVAKQNEKASDIAKDNGKGKFTEKVDFNKSEMKRFAKNLKDFQPVTVRPIEFRNAADTGMVNLRLLGKEFIMELQPEKDIDGDLTNIQSYSGKISGEPESKASFTVANQVLLGRIEIEGKSYYLRQTNKRHRGKVVHVAYSSDMMKKRNISVYNTDKVIPPKSPKSLPADAISDSSSIFTSSVSTLGTTTVDLLSGYDTEFENEFSDPVAEIYDMVSSANDAFSAAGVSLHINDYKSYANIQNGGACDVRNDFWSDASGDWDSTNSDLAFLFSGKEFSGDAIGCSTGYPYYYAAAQMVDAGWFSSYDADFEDRAVLTAHELGHNFDADHQGTGGYNNAYHWDYYIWDKYTTMWTPFQGTGIIGGVQLEFSDRNNHGDSTHDNVRRISETKSVVAGFQ